MYNCENPEYYEEPPWWWWNLQEEIDFNLWLEEINYMEVLINGK
jgi:hypothetical protein